MRCLLLAYGHTLSNTSTGLLRPSKTFSWAATFILVHRLLGVDVGEVVVVDDELARQPQEELFTFHRKKEHAIHIVSVKFDLSSSRERRESMTLLPVGRRSACLDCGP